MPEDLEDRLVDFEMMLEGVMSDYSNEDYKTRLLEYWYSLSKEIKGKADEEVSQDLGR